ncbi:MAG TPA: NADPH-dependent FMN reductase [Candidatus Saccharimonadales bacterium]
MKIAVFVGSLQQNSVNKKLAGTMEKVAGERMEFEYIDVNLPLFNQDLEENYPVEARRVKDAVETADGILFVMPEYNRSVPGVLKNAIDWASRPWGTNSFKGKPAGVVGGSIGPVGTAVGQSDMRHIAAFLEMEMLGQPELYLANATHDMFDEQGIMKDERWYKNITEYVRVFGDWVESHKK